MLNERHIRDHSSKLNKRDRWITILLWRQNCSYWINIHRNKVCTIYTYTVRYLLGFSREL